MLLVAGWPVVVLLTGAGGDFVVVMVCPFGVGAAVDNGGAPVVVGAPVDVVAGRFVVVALPFGPVRLESGFIVVLVLAPFLCTCKW